MEIDLKVLTPIWDFDSPIYAAAWTVQKERGPDAQAEPAHHAFHNLKQIIQKCFAHFDTDTTGYRLFISGEGNFRREEATILPYKGNRPTEKPIHYAAVRDYAVTFWQAELVDGMEAEDQAIMTFNEEEDTCLVHQDKDLDQVPGIHFNYRKETAYYVSPLEANRNLWRQVLIGDKGCDNILGIPDMGPKTADPLLKNVRSFRDGWELAKREYFKAFGEQRCLLKPLKSGKLKKDGTEKLAFQYEKGEGLVRHDGSIIDWKSALIENCKLVYLRRSVDDVFKVLD